jgi:hypothetical protein
MQWKLILSLSLFALAMAIATTYVIPSNVGAVLWPTIWIACAFLIARTRPEKPFLHGFSLGLANWVWVAAMRVILVDAYVARHANEAPPIPAEWDGPITDAFRRYQLPIPGASALAIGLLTWVASKIVIAHRRSRSRYG